MRRFVTLVVLITCAFSVFGQTKNIVVSGTVIEDDTKESIIQATVQLLSLPDSTYVTGIATVAQGKFTLPKVAAGKYVLKVSYIGMQPSIVPLQLVASKPNHSVGTITLKSDAILLQEAVITAEAPPVTVKEDTTVYAASAYRVAEGAMLEELVKKLPGAEVSEDGKITINGKEIKKIMVDGKEFFSDDPKVSMKNLPVNMVENVKAYDKKSDMARITGIDDGEEETVLDLTVKKGMKQGWIGNFIGGVGNKERYEAGGMLSRFKDDTSFSVIGSLNNTNNKGFSEFGDAGQGMGRGAGTGITSARSLGMNFAKDTKKLQMGGNLQYGYSDNDARSRTTSETFLGEEESSFENRGNDSRRKRHDLRADFRFEWRPDTMTTIIFRPSASYSKTNSTTGSWSETLDSNHEYVNMKNSNSYSNSKNYSLNGRLQIFRRLNNKGRNLYMGANFGYSDSDRYGVEDSRTLFFPELGGDPDTLDILRNTDYIGDSRNWSVSASYTEPVFKNHFLQLRYEFSHRKRFSQSLVYDPALMPINEYVDSLSSRVENFYDSHNIDLSLRGVYPKLMYNVGFSLTPQSSRSETTIGPNANKEFPTQKVTNFAPQAMLRYMFNKQHTLMFRYRGRSSVPDIQDLQEVIDITNPLEQRYGNPNLKPSYTHNVMMFYNKFVPESMRSYAFNLFYNATQNAVANSMTYDRETGVYTYRRVNVNGNWNARGYFSFNTPLKNKKFTISANTNAGYSDAASYQQVERESNAVISTTHNLQLGQQVRGNYRTDMFDVSLNASINYNLTRNSKQTKGNRETFDYYFGGNTNITLPWDLYLSTDANYRIKEGYGTGFNNNEVIWNAQLSKNFLKNKAATIRVKIYDILQQQTNLSRSISETRMTDTEYNTLGSYFMVHFVYRLNTMGGKGRGNRSGTGGPERRGPGGGMRMHGGGGRPL